MIKVLIVYLISLLLCIGGFIPVVRQLRKKTEKKIRFASLFIGVIAAVAFFLVMTVLFRATFRNLNYYNTALFSTLVGTLYIFLMSIIVSVLIKCFLFDRYKSEAGHSFLFGFGVTPVAFFVIYIFIMFVSLVINGLFNGPCTVEEGGKLCFEDNTMISVFQPVGGHVSFAILFLVLLLVLYSEGVLLQKISEEKHSLWISVVWMCGFHLFKALAITTIPFISMYGLKHWELALVVAILSAPCVLFARFLPKVVVAEEYTKQFE